MSDTIYTRPGATYFSEFEGAPTGLTGTVGVRLINDLTDVETMARTTAGISEVPAGSGHYLFKGTGPAPGDYSVVWDTGSVTPTTVASDRLLSTASGAAPVLSYDLGTDVGKVRFEIDDTDLENFELADQEIELLLSTEGAVLAAAAGACEVLARRYAKRYDISTDDQSLKRSQTAKAWMEMASELRKRVEKGEGIGTIKTEKVDGYNDTGVDNESIDGATPATGHARVGWLNPDEVP